MYIHEARIYDKIDEHRSTMCKKMDEVKNLIREQNSRLTKVETNSKWHTWSIRFLVSAVFVLGSAIGYIRLV